MPSRYLIYLLSDPRTNEPRYVGKSSSEFARPKYHGEHAQKKNPDGSFLSYQHIHNWIRSIRNDGFDYEIDALEEFGEIENCEALNEAERFWIAYWRFIGANLLNIRDGGDGGNGFGSKNTFYGKRHKAETVAKISATKRAQRIRTRGTTGMKLSAETRAKMRGPRPQMSGEKHPMFGKKHSLEAREKIRAKALGKKRGPYKKRVRIDERA